MYYIDEIHPGKGDYRSKILYAVVIDKKDNDKIVCSATLDYILLAYYHMGATNYEEALKRYIEFNEMLRLT